MIQGTYSDETLSAISQVIKLENAFIVCGSRFFGDAKDTSDFDFVTEDIGLIDLLMAAGWVKSKSDENEYLDSNTVRILNRGNVQIIFAESVERRIKARDYIVANRLDRSKTEDWEKAYEAI